MNNYSNTEKSLKKWLKRKTKITLGMVVAFMIMGTGVFAEGEYTIKGDNGLEFVNQILKENETAISGTVTVNIGSECNSSSLISFMNSNNQNYTADLIIKIDELTKPGTTETSYAGLAYDEGNPKSKLTGNLKTIFTGNNNFSGTVVAVGGAHLIGNSEVVIDGGKFKLDALKYTHGIKNNNILAAGASWGGIIDGNTSLTIKNNAEVTVQGIASRGIYGGSYNGTVNGNTGVYIENSTVNSYVVKTDGTVSNLAYIYGGGSTVNGSSIVKITGSNVEGKINGAGGIVQGTSAVQILDGSEIKGDITGGNGQLGSSVEIANNNKIIGDITGGSGKAGTSVSIKNSIIDGNVTAISGNIDGDTHIYIGEGTTFEGENKRVILGNASNSSYASIYKANSGTITIDQEKFENVSLSTGLFETTGENGKASIILTDKVKEFDSDIIEKGSTSAKQTRSFDEMVLNGKTDLNGTFANIDKVKRENNFVVKAADNAIVTITDKIDKTKFTYDTNKTGKFILNKQNIVDNVTGTGTIVISSEMKDNKLITNGGLKVTDSLSNGVKIGTTITTDDLIGKDVEDALNNLNNSVVAANKNNTVEISEGKLFGKATGTGTNDGVKNIKSEIKSNTVIGIEDLATINYLSWKQEMNSLTQRMGELRDSSAEHGVWARVYGGKVENGSQYDNEYQTYQIGYDKKYIVDNGRVYLGYLVSYTDGETNYNLGHGENYSVGAGIYATWMNNNGHYVDVLYKVSRLNNKFDVNGSNGLNSKGKYDTYGISLSTEYGKRFDITDKWFAEPSVGMHLGRLGDETYITNSGIEVEQDSIYTAEGRIGTTIGYKFNDKGNVYARTHIVKEFAGDVDAEYNTGVANLKTSEDMGDTWFEFGVGANYRFTENMNVYVDVQKTEEATVDNKWQGNLGFRYEF